MTTSTQLIAPWLERTGHIKGPDHFLLASGRHSRYIIDMKGIPPYIEDAIREIVIERFGSKRVDAVVGVPRGGDPFAQIMAPLLSMYTQRQDGAHQVLLLKGPDGQFSVPKGVSVAGLKVLVVDDVGTTYGSLLRACRVLERAGASVVCKLVIINRNPDLARASAAKIEFLEHHPIPMYRLALCPMCKKGIPLADPNAA